MKSKDSTPVFTGINDSSRPVTGSHPIQKAEPDPPEPADTLNPVVSGNKNKPEADTVFTAIGTEPFWAVYVIKEKKILFHPAEGPDVEAAWVAPAYPDQKTILYASKSGNTNFRLTILKKKCSDGMSERNYTYEIQLLLGEQTYKGCGWK